MDHTQYKYSATLNIPLEAFSGSSVKESTERIAHSLAAEFLPAIKGKIKDTMMHYRGADQYGNYSSFRASCYILTEAELKEIVDDAVTNKLLRIAGNISTLGVT